MEILKHNIYQDSYSHTNSRCDVRNIKHEIIILSSLFPDFFDIFRHFRHFLIQQFSDFRILFSFPAYFQHLIYDNGNFRVDSVRGPKYTYTKIFQVVFNVWDKTKQYPWFCIAHILIGSYLAIHYSQHFVHCGKLFSTARSNVSFF